MIYKLFETEHGQLLFRIVYDEKDDAFKILFECERYSGMNEINASITFSFVGDSGEQKAKQALAEVTEEMAIAVYESMILRFLGPKTESDEQEHF